MTCFRCKWGMDSNEVCSTNNIVNGSLFYFELLSTFCSQERVVSKNLHTKGFGTFSHFATDSTHSEYTQGFSAQLNAQESLSIPCSCDGLRVSLWNVTGQCHHHCESMLTSRNCISIWSIDDNNTTFCCSIQFDIIYSYTCTTYYFKIFSCFDDFVCYGSLTADK
ncbi:hypothetical protein D3C76_359350 [compost metagenome]